jgi:hypothetical protein
LEGKKMLENVSRDSPKQSTSEAGGRLIPDPWETTKPTSKVDSILKSWQIIPEPHPLLAPAGKPEVLRLPTSTAVSELNPLQALLLSGLKIGAYDGGKLTDWIENALALLRWMGTIAQGTPEEIPT